MKGDSTKPDGKAATSRRDFLKLAVAGAPAMAVAAVTGGTGTVAIAGTEAGEGLRRTAHVNKYLETARF